MAGMEVVVGGGQPETREAVRAALERGESETAVIARLQEGGWPIDEARGLVGGVKAELESYGGDGAAWEAARGFVRGELGKGVRAEAVAAELVGAGWKQWEAEALVERTGAKMTGVGRAGVVTARRPEMQRALRNMKVGGIWLAIGLVVTVGTMAMAGDGGHYVLAWGAIVFGGLQFGVGVLQWVGAGGK